MHCFHHFFFLGCIILVSFFFFFAFFSFMLFSFSWTFILSIWFLLFNLLFFDVLFLYIYFFILFLTLSQYICFIFSDTFIISSLNTSKVSFCRFSSSIAIFVILININLPYETSSFSFLEKIANLLLWIELFFLLIEFSIIFWIFIILFKFRLYFHLINIRNLNLIKWIKMFIIILC